MQRDVGVPEGRINVWGGVRGCRVRPTKIGVRDADAVLRVFPREEAAIRGGPRVGVWPPRGTKLSAARERAERRSFHAFERRATESTNGQRRLGGGKRTLVSVLPTIDSSVKAVRENDSSRAFQRLAAGGRRGPARALRRGHHQE